MSDIRFIIIGIGLIFSGIIILAISPSELASVTLQAEMGECFEYHDDAPPTKIDCDMAMQNKLFVFTLVVVLVGAGITGLVKGARGTWDQNVKPEDMVGPGKSFDARDKPKGSDSET